ncbi:MAG: 2-hydroxyglutaryl-CoA dehydratase [Deltaproteobacteria bacterium]|nr:2-hydroxyglutaryl-CoA dehydratase [Deltaproteobacteria bacterium]
MVYSLGIDIGSAFSKGILLGDEKVLASQAMPSGGDFKMAADKIRKNLLDTVGISSKDISYTVATGYGSKNVTFADSLMTDLSCHGRGVFSSYPSVRTLVDVGDLYSKAFRIDGEGNLTNFLLSGKCAGGSGRILLVIAKVLGVKVEDIGELSLRSKKMVEFSTGCVVFAESEAVSRLAEGVAKEDLLAGIHRALAAQLVSLAERIKIEKDLALVGGGARDSGLIKAVEDAVGYSITVPPEPHMTAAIGAAIMAFEKAGA